MKSVFGSDVVPPDVTEIGSVPAAVMSEAGMEARSSFALMKVVSRGFVPFGPTLTTAPGANPPPFTVSVNAGPPVATIDGEMDVSSMPKPDSGALCGEPGPLSETLIVADSFPAMDGVNTRPTSQTVPVGMENDASPGQKGLPLGAAGTNWKSALFVPLMVKPVASTLRVAPEKLISVAFIVGLVVPMPTGPKFTGDIPTVTGMGVP